MSQVPDPFIDQLMRRGSEMGRPMPAPPMRPADTIGNLGSTLGNIFKTVSSRGPQMPYSRPAGTIRTMDFIDNNRNGIDDRDEPPPFGGIPSSPPVRLPPRPVSSIPAPGAGGVGSLLRPYNPMETYSGLVQRGMATQPPMPQSPYGGIMDYLMNRPVFSRGERPEGSILPPAGPQQMPQQPAFDQEAFRAQLLKDIQSQQQQQQQQPAFDKDAFRTQLLEEFQAQQQPAFDKDAFRTQLLEEFQAQQQPAFDKEAFRQQIIDEIRPGEQISALEQQIADLRSQLTAAQEGRVDPDALRQQLIQELNPQQQLSAVEQRIADLQAQVAQGSRQQPVDVDEIRRQIMRELQSNEGRAMLEREQLSAYQSPGGMTDASREEARLAAIEEAIRPTMAPPSRPGPARGNQPMTDAAREEARLEMTAPATAIPARRTTPPVPVSRTIPPAAQNFQLPVGFRMPTNLFSGIR